MRSSDPNKPPEFDIVDYALILVLLAIVVIASIAILWPHVFPCDNENMIMNLFCY